MTREEIAKELRRCNKTARPDTLRIYGDAAFEYLDAQGNIEKRGAVVRHPTTGAPIANPYLKIRDAASKVMLSIRMQTGRIFE